MAEQKKDVTTGYGKVLFFSFLLIVSISNSNLFSQEFPSKEVEVGYRDYRYRPSGSEVTVAVTEAKPESKLWYHDGFWWGILWNPDTYIYSIFKLNFDTQSWVDVGPSIDERPRSSPDVLWDGTKLFIASRAKMDHKSEHGSQAARIYRLSYDSATQSYSHDDGFPVEINERKSESLVLAKDSTGQLWVTWTQSNRVMVNHSDDEDQTDWGEPFELPSAEGKLWSDDISSIVAFNGDRIGVMWSNQDDGRMYFAVHKDSKGDKTWESRETALSDPDAGEIADDHINLAVACGNDGTIMAVSKTSLHDPGDPKIMLLIREIDGDWEHYPFSFQEKEHTRPIVLFHQETSDIYILAQGLEHPHSIFYKKTNLSDPSFSPGFGTEIITSKDDNDVNNVTATKQCLTNQSGLLILASDSDTKRYLHNYMELGGVENEEPVAVDDEATTSRNLAVEIDVLQNDYDPDGNIDITTVEITANPDHGAVSVEAATGRITYSPDEGFTGNDDFRYRFRDNLGETSNKAEVQIEVLGANQAPVANDDQATTEEETPVTITVLENDDDNDGTLIASSLVIIDDVAHGDTDVDHENGEVTYTPDPGFSGEDSFSYTVEDNAAETSNVATVRINVVVSGDGGSYTFTPVHDGQVKIPDPGNNYGDKSTTKVEENEFVSYFKFDVSGLSGPVAEAKLTLFVSDDNSDGSEDGGSVYWVGNTYSDNSDLWEEDELTAGNAPEIDGGELSSAGTVESGGLAEFDVKDAINGNGTYSFAVANHSGDLAKYYSREGDKPPELFIRTSGSGGNKPPVAEDDAAETTGGVAITIHVLENDHDDNDLAPESVKIENQADHGTTQVRSSGNIVYTPESNFVGTDSFSYTVEDNDGAESNSATVTILVAQANQPPFAHDDEATTPTNVAVEVDILANDTDDVGLDPESVKITNNPDHGSAEIDNETGSVTYTPDDDFAGEDSFSYTVSDEEGAESNSATVTITVTTVNQAPVAHNDEAATSGGVSVEIDILANDTDDDGLEPESVEITNNADHGTTDIDDASGAVTYTPDDDFSGEDSFSYTVSDKDGAVSNTAVVTIAITEGGSGGQQTFTAVHDGQVKLGSPNNNYGDKSTAKVEAGDFIFYLKFNVTGLTGAPQSAVLRLKVTDELSDGSENGGSVYLVSNDFDGGGAWNESELNAANAPEITSQPLDGSGPVKLNEIVDFDVLPAVSSNGIVSFAIKSVSTDQAKYFTREGDFPPQLIVTTGTGPVNEPPVASNDEAETDEDIAKVINVLNNDSDPDGDLDETTVEIVDAPDHGSATVSSSSGKVTYTPESGFSGSDNFKYTVRDDDGAVSNAAKVNITVNQVDDEENTFTFEPVEDGQIKYADPGKNYGDKSSAKIEEDKFAFYLQFQVSELGGAVESAQLRLHVGDESSDGGDDGGRLHSVSNNFDNSSSRWDEDALNADNAPEATGSEIASVGSVAPGDVVEFDVSPVINGNGYYSFALLTKSGNKVTYVTKEGDFAPELYITTGEESGNQAPIAQNDNASTVENIPVVMNILANDSDPDGSLDVHSVSIAESPEHGSVIVNPNSGIITYSPETDFQGTDEFAYTVKDNEGEKSNRAIVMIEVNGSSEPVTVTFEPVADAQIKIADPTANYGDKSYLKVESGDFRSVLKFEVTGLDGPVSDAALRLHVSDSNSDGSESGGSVFQVANVFSDGVTPWNEDELTAENAPEPGSSALSTFGAVTAGSSVDFDVTEAVLGNGEVSFEIISSSTDQVRYESKEGDFPPELIVRYFASASSVDADKPILMARNDDLQSEQLPLEFSLKQNYPNPFNGATTIEYDLAEKTNVTLTIYSVTGQEVAQLFDGTQSAGNKRFVWNARDRRGVEVASGVYFMQLKAGGKIFTRKISLQK